MTITLNFVKERETKRTIRFKEQPQEGKPEVIGTLYVQKFVAKDCDWLTVTLEIPDE